MVLSIISTVISVDCLMFTCGAPSITGWICDKLNLQGALQFRILFYMSTNKKANKQTVVQFVLYIVCMVVNGLDQNWAAVCGWLCAVIATVNIWYADKYIEILQDYIKREK